METQRKRFLDKVNQNSGRKIRDLTECWLWKGKKHTSGYAQWQSDWAKENKVLYCHQSSYKLFKDANYTPSREHPLSHLCEGEDYEHRICCNPDHLYVAKSIAENVADRDANRGSYQTHKTAGTKSGSALFTKEQLQDIRKKREDGMYYAEIAEEYNCCRRTIEKICLGKTYKND
jgi:hypothetical protein